MEKSKPTSIPDDTYDALICCAGFFPGLISPLALPELVRITKPGKQGLAKSWQTITYIIQGGIVMWNVVQGQDEFVGDYGKHGQVVQDLVDAKQWRHFRPVQTFDDLLFSDSGAAYLGGYDTTGMPSEGLVFIMSKL